MLGPGNKACTSESFVRCSKTELPMPIFTVHIAETTSSINVSLTYFTFC